MKGTFEVIFDCRSEAETEALERTLSPDNRSFPKDQTFESSRTGRSLRFRIASPRPTSGLASVLSLLADAKLFQEIWTISS